MEVTKILAIQFKYLGDAVILTPALKAMALQMSNIQLHVLVAAEVAPLLQNLPWITKVWAMPRHRGKLKLTQTIPFVQALRREKFARSIDFGGNDRGAILSYLSGANKRLGSIAHGEPKWMQRICYTEMVKHKNSAASYFDLHFELLRAWNIERPDHLALETNVDNVEVGLMCKILSDDYIVFHISTSQPKKDWPLNYWVVLYNLASRAGLRIIFSAGPNERERKILDELILMLPEAEFLPPVESLKIFLSILKRSKMLVCGDTGPLHFTEGLGVPVLGIFGVGNSIRQVVPIYSENKVVCAAVCACDLLHNNTDVCQSPRSCMSSIQPETVFLKFKSMLDAVNLMVVK